MDSFSALKPRRKTRVVNVGDIRIGGDNPIRVQTMTNTDTLDIVSTVAPHSALYAGWYGAYSFDHTYSEACSGARTYPRDASCRWNIRTAYC